MVTRSLADLKRAGIPARAKGAAAYFKAYEKLTFFGVDSPTVRRMAGRIKEEDGRDWRLREALAFADSMVAQPQLEAKGLGICVLGRFRDQFSPSMLQRAKQWLAKHCTDWASTDNLCGEVIGPLLVEHTELVTALRGWRSSPHLYVRRASAVALIPLARKGEALDDAYDAALALGGEPHHLLQKAAGWLLREAGKADMPRLERFLRRHGAQLGRTTVSYAVERFDPAKRQALLAATRAARASCLRRS
ncbi:MAG TPA: DNA alkylation repair protein [Vicinamibacterales bacterium]|nr:DNA alkylation repair protein [Vicinamibacterales bacterium]